MIEDYSKPVCSNLFTYCRSNPVRYRDDGGYETEECWDSDGSDDLHLPGTDDVGGGGAYGGSYTYASSVLNDVFPTGINSGYNTHINAESYSSLLSTAQNMLYSCDFVYDSVGASSFALKNGVCFSAGTLISGEAGLIAIECICVGDLVWAADPETGETALKRVLRLFRNETSEWVHLTVDGEEIVCTPGHKFYSPVKGWTAACQLRAGDILVTLNGEYVVLEKVQHELLENPEITYNFEVEGFHTYYVGGAEVLVHNLCETDIYNSVNASPAYRSDFIKAPNGTKKIQIKNGALKNELNQYGKKWKKVFSDGYLGGEKASLHYFQDISGKVFDVKYKMTWSVLHE